MVNESYKGLETTTTNTVVDEKEKTIAVDAKLDTLATKKDVNDVLDKTLGYNAQLAQTVNNNLSALRSAVGEDLYNTREDIKIMVGDPSYRVSYMGSVDYYKLLPLGAQLGDIYTVKYTDEAGTHLSGADYIWVNGESEGELPHWKPLGTEFNRPETVAPDRVNTYLWAAEQGQLKWMKFNLEEESTDAVIPDCPTTEDGTFVLKATVLDGVVSYKWVSEQ